MKPCLENKTLSEKSLRVLSFLNDRDEHSQTLSVLVDSTLIQNFSYRVIQEGHGMYERGRVKLKYVLITLSGGIIDQVTFYDSEDVAVENLAKYVKDMNPEENDAAVYGPDGIVANAKIFLDEDDQLIDGAAVIESVN
jgi:hypothetical protein